MKYVIPVLCGLAGTFIIGLILCPIVFPFFMNLELGLVPKSIGTSNKDLVMMGIFAIWILASTANGGFVCVQFARIKTRLTVSLLIIVTVSLLAMFIGRDFFQLNSIPWICLFIAGFIIGAWVGIRYRNKKAMRKQKG